MRITMKKAVFLAAAAVLLLSQAVNADIFFKQKQHTDPAKVMGRSRPAADVVSETWITPEGVRTDRLEDSVLVLPGRNKIIRLNHRQKTYTVQLMNMEKMLENAGGDQAPEQKKAVRSMMKSMMKMDVKVTPSSETKTIRGWQCRKYVLVMDTMAGRVENLIWATTELEVDNSLSENFNTAMFSGMPGMKQRMEQIRQEIKKIQGVPVRTISTHKIMGSTSRSTTELLDYRKADAPDGIFAIPAGYREKRIN